MNPNNPIFFITVAEDVFSDFTVRDITRTKIANVKFGDLAFLEA